MKNLLLLTLVCALAFPVYGAVGVSATGKANLSKKEVRALEKAEKKQDRQEARMERLANKMEKRMEKENIEAADSIFSNTKFLIGAIGVLVAIALAFFAPTFIWAIIGLAALVFLIWGVLEYTGEA